MTYGSGFWGRYLKALLAPTHIAQHLSHHPDLFYDEKKGSLLHLCEIYLITYTATIKCTLQL